MCVRRDREGNKGGEDVLLLLNREFLTGRLLREKSLKIL